MALDGDMAWPPPEWSADAGEILDPFAAPEPSPVAHVDEAGNVVGFVEPERVAPVQPVAAPPAPDAPHIDASGQVVGYQAPEVAPAAAPVAQSAPEPVYDGGWEQFISNENAAPPEDVPLHAQPIDQAADGLADSPVPESMWQPQAVEQETSRLLDMPEEEYAKHVAAEEAERRAFRVQEAARIEDENRQAMERNREADRVAREDTRRKLVDVNTHLQELSKQDIDRDRWMSSRSGPQKVALYASAMISGFLNPGGKNGAIELVQNEIDRDIDIQVQNLAQRKAGLQAEAGLVAQLYDLSGDEYQAAETARMAMYGDAIKKLELDAQQYDPLGSQAMKTRDAVMEFRGRQQAAAAKMEETLYKRGFEERKFQLDVNADRRAQEKHRKSMAGGGAAKQMPPEYWQALYGVAPPVPMSDKEFKSWVGTTGDIRKLTGNDVEGQKKSAELVKAQADAEKAVRENDPNDRARQLGVGGIVRKDGTPVLFRSPESAEKVAKQKAATDMATGLIDKLRIARDRHGFSSEMVRSDEWRQMQADYAALQLEIKNTAELGVLAGPDMDIIGRALGTKDPTELRDVTKGLDSARENLVTKLNTTIKAGDDKAARYEPPKTEIAKASERPFTENFNAAMAPLSDFAKKDPDERHRVVQERRAAYAEIARQAAESGNSIPLKLAAKKAEAQHKAGEIDDATLNAIREDLASAQVSIQSQQVFDNPSHVGGPPALLGDDWVDRALGGD